IAELLDRAERCRMRQERLGVAAQQAGIEQAADALGLDGAEAMAYAADLDLDQRLEPQHAARAVADDLDRHPGRGGRTGDRCRHCVSSDGHGSGIPRNEDTHGASWLLVALGFVEEWDGHAPASFSSASSLAGVSRPTMRPSSMAEGAVAHRPRQ